MKPQQALTFLGFTDDELEALYHACGIYSIYGELQDVDTTPGVTAHKKIAAALDALDQ